MIDNVQYQTLRDSGRRLKIGRPLRLLLHLSPHLLHAHADLSPANGIDGLHDLAAIDPAFLVAVEAYYPR